MTKFIDENRDEITNFYPRFGHQTIEPYVHQKIIKPGIVTELLMQ